MSGMGEGSGREGSTAARKACSEPYKLKTWYCKIGEVEWGQLPDGSDGPMREAIQRAYREITGQDADFIFSGWGAELTEPERAVVEDRMPNV